MKNINTFLKRNFITFICIFILIFSFFNFYLMSTLKHDIENKSTISEKCNYFLFSTNLDAVLVEKKLEIDKSDLYVFPTIRNILCLGKVGNVVKNDSTFNGIIYTNTKIFNFIIIFTNFFILFLVLFSKKLTNPKYYLLFIFINGGIIFNFYQSLNVASLNFIVIPLLIGVLDKIQLSND